MTQAMVKVELIDANPWQPRMSEDAEHLANLATSIADDGLMQIPSARQVGDRYQLAFGHSRLAAYKLLASLQKVKLLSEICEAAESESASARAWQAAQTALDNLVDFDQMPLNIMEIDDEAMFRFAVSENVQRRDLSPIETARAMLRYRDEFHKNSADIGSLFGVNDATVRGKLRLLDLPDQVQARVSTGELSEGTARTLLTVQKVLGEEKTNDLAGKMAGYKNPEQVIRETQSAFYSEKSIVEMWNPSYNQGPALGGEGLWPLTWTYPLSLPTSKEAMKGWKGEKQIVRWFSGSGVSAPEPIQTVFNDIAYRINSPLKPQSWEQIKEEVPEWVEAVDYLRAISNPPACTPCPMYIKLDNRSYCGNKTCWKRKQAKWIDQEFANFVQMTGIPELSEDEADQARDPSYSEQKTFMELIEKRDPDLRLVKHYNEYGKDFFTNSKWASVKDLSPERRNQFKKTEAQRSMNDLYERGRKLSDASGQFVKECARERFADAFQGLQNLGASLALAGRAENAQNWFDKELKEAWGKANKAEKLHLMRLECADKALENRLNWDVKSKGPTATAKHLQGLAVTWGGITLPENWLEMAAGYEPFAGLEVQPVSVETVAEEVEAE